MGALALFLVLAGGTAYAVDGPLAGQNTVGSEDIIGNEVRSDDIANGRIFNIDLADGAVTGAKVNNGSLGGADLAGDSLGGTQIQESTLSQVPSALLGGRGRSIGGNTCNPGSPTYIDCGFVTLNLPATSRVFMTGSALGHSENGATAIGFCRLVTSLGAIDGSAMSAGAATLSEGIALNAVTGPIGPGNVDFGIECRQDLGSIDYVQIQLSAVALSPD